MGEQLNQGQEQAWMDTACQEADMGIEWCGNDGYAQGAPMTCLAQNPVGTDFVTKGLKVIVIV